VYAALVLAGRREGQVDTLAREAHAPHRALLKVGGLPMLERVVRTLEESPRVGSIAVSSDAPEVLREVPGLARRIEAGTLRLLPSERSPSRSALAGLESLGPAQPVLVTTADHALLTPAIVDHFLEAAERSAADLAVGVVAVSRVRSRFPESRRTVLPLRGEGFCGANLFAFRTPQARRAAEFWVRAESFRKRPWRLVSVFGPVALALFALRRLDLERALERASRAIGARIRPIALPFAEAAVDVDRLEDLELARRVVAQG
jgi:GTP:adenosylcobinamide-phosphate guanylyltransferase